MKAIFRYPGSKWSIVDWIISYFPAGYEKMVYLEPFLGSGAVFFNKLPSAVETINDLDGDAATTRLRGDTTHLVQIERMDALRLIERYNNPDVLMYIDPPYVRSARKSGRLYQYEMTDADHEQLLDLLTQSKAKIVLSGYKSALYDQQLHDWNKFTTMSQTTSTEMAEEYIWLNYDPPCRQIGIWEVTNV